MRSKSTIASGIRPRREIQIRLQQLLLLRGRHLQLQRVHRVHQRIIANFSPEKLRTNAEQAGLLGLFDIPLSTDANHSYKPDPRAYADLAGVLQVVYGFGE